jgi:hypothetical protein
VRCSTDSLSGSGGILHREVGTIYIGAQAKALGLLLLLLLLEKICQFRSVMQASSAQRKSPSSWPRDRDE